MHYGHCIFADGPAGVINFRLPVAFTDWKEIVTLVFSVSSVNLAGEMFCAKMTFQFCCAVNYSGIIIIKYVRRISVECFVLKLRGNTFGDWIFWCFTNIVFSDVLRALLILVADRSRGLTAIPAPRQLSCGKDISILMHSAALIIRVFLIIRNVYGVLMKHFVLGLIDKIYFEIQYFDALWAVTSGRTAGVINFRLPIAFTDWKEVDGLHFRWPSWTFMKTANLNYVFTQ